MVVGGVVAIVGICRVALQHLRGRGRRRRQAFGTKLLSGPLAYALIDQCTAGWIPFCEAT